MEHLDPERPIRFQLGPNGKLVRSRVLTNMYAGEEPEIARFKNLSDRDEAIREKLKEELQELLAAESKSDMLDEAADFMTAAAAFRETVEAEQRDSEIFGIFQNLIQRRGLNMQEIEIRRLERDSKLGLLVIQHKVLSVLIGPDNPRRQYYLNHPDRFPRLD